MERDRRDRREESRRPRRGDGMVPRVRWYAWAFSRYATAFGIGTVVLLVSVIGFAAAKPLFVPGIVPEPSYGMALAGWTLLTLFGIRMWIKERMVAAGVESR